MEAANDNFRYATGYLVGGFESLFDFPHVQVFNQLEEESDDDFVVRVKAEPLLLSTI